MLSAPISLRKFSPLVDFAILLFLGTTIYGLISFGQEWQADFHPSTDIDLSFKSIPIYAIFSTIRAIAAYFLSLIFTLVVGYIAAKFKWAERLIIPLLDILQSIPVLGFLPGLVLGLIAIFPRTNVGLELSAILMIFTGQVWNMTFSFYSSLKAVPPELSEAAEVMDLDWKKRLIRLELPFSAVNLAWNSLMSMAGGWFFLSVCEAFTLGDREFRLPGLGSYMAAAIDQGNNGAMCMGITAMIAVIILMNIVVWRPTLAWVHRFRLEDVPGVAENEPFIQLMLKESNIYHFFRRLIRKPPKLFFPPIASQVITASRDFSNSLRARIAPVIGSTKSTKQNDAIKRRLSKTSRLILWFFSIITIAFMFWSFLSLGRIFATISASVWIMLLKNMSWTLLRVVTTLVLSTLWTVPVGIWIGMSARRVKLAQPIVQILASFPAPMLYPIAIAAFFSLGFNFDVASTFLMLLGVQWYVLFNVLAGAMRIPLELIYVTDLFETSFWRRCRTLYVPSIFPALVTGWITAAGGAWNASIVSEYIAYKGQTLSTPGLGSTISLAAGQANFPLLAASLSVMVIVVIILNRTFWTKIYRLSQTRFRMDL
jgi:NitT/TauT family transport system permease protein